MRKNWVLDYTAAWHDTWEIIGAFATFVAVALALVGFWFEARRAQRADARAEAAEAGRAADRAATDADRAAADAARIARERRAQALLVLAYPEWHEEHRGLGGRAVGHWRVRHGNYSASPIFDVFAQAFVGSAVDSEMTSSVLVPGGAGDFLTTATDNAAPPVAVIFFRDLAGVRWKRLQTGELIEVDENRRPI
ncbi:hypothetical protein [Cellulomonas chitinilytica]|uniref:hypothetical protein n=1 Tax=Cellulomonas chitinilytica TaxID=398759 RepID=UPI001940F5E2|nr:hypothetical protein [Cellulomonas chitinilytica]